jgi:PAS domain S-box-containing protein
MPTKGSSSTSDDSLHLSGELTTLQQELAHCRRLAQQADERLRLAMDVGCLGIWNWSIPDNQITREGYHEELFGLAPGSFSGTYDDFLACLHPDDREAVQQEVARCLALRQDYRQEYRVRWPNGSVHWIEGRARIQCDEQGQPVRMMGVVQDITDRKLMEEQQVRFRALFDAAKDAVLIADDDRRYVEANPAAGELLGVVPEQIRGRFVDEFVKGEVQGNEVGTAWQHFQTAGVQRGECRLRRADGTFLDVEYSAASNFVPGLHLSVLRDVSERKRAEEALAQQAGELARSNADLQQFAYVTSHDLQEPLRGIINFSQLLTKRYRGQLDAEADTFLEYIVASAYRMKGLIDSLLTYSRVVNLEAIPFAPVQVDAALHWATMNLQTVMEETKATVTHDHLPIVMADHVQLVQLFQNLISNAIKYRKPQEPPQIHVSAEERAHEWVVSVRDNGIGIKSGYTERIFGVFKRLHGREVPGTGIGLAICKRIVEKHGGQIWVNSEPGQGATFCFTIPSKSRASERSR